MQVLPSRTRLPSPTVGRLFALLTGFTSLSVVLLRLHVIMSPGNLKLWQWQWQWMSSSPLLMLSVVFLLLLSLLLIFPSRLEESLKPRRRRTRSKNLDNMIPLRIQQSAPVVRHAPHRVPSGFADIGPGVAERRFTSIAQSAVARPRTMDPSSTMGRTKSSGEHALQSFQCCCCLHYRRNARTAQQSTLST